MIPKAGVVQLESLLSLAAAFGEDLGSDPGEGEKFFGIFPFVFPLLPVREVLKTGRPALASTQY